MTFSKGLYRAVCALYALIFSLMLFAKPAYAINTGSLTLSYKQEGAVFSVYRVAVYLDDNYKLVGDFSKYSVELPGTSWSDTAETLAAYVSCDNLTPTAVGTIENGTVTFENLKKALYLVVGTSTTSDGYIYTPAVFLVHVTSDGVVSVVKYEMTPVEPTTITVSVTKIWDDVDNHDGIRPSSVTVTLYKNGKATTQTVTLNVMNNWKESFTELDEYTDGVLNEYTVVETSIEGYTATVTGDAITGYVITNTHIPEEEKTPQTGYSTSLYITMMLLSTAEIIALVLYKVNKKRGEAIEFSLK
ncbi:MAG: Cna B-type domain-containing protein [Firmicutes bacterium]|nr:Cna B-type domain-containing protein [Bacillota bacterium]